MTVVATGGRATERTTVRTVRRRVDHAVAQLVRFGWLEGSALQILIAGALQRRPSCREVA